MAFANTNTGLPTSNNRKNNTGAGLTTWQKRIDDQKKYHCPRTYCDTKPDRATTLARHMAEGTDRTRFWCRYCPKTFCGRRGKVSHKGRCSHTGTDFQLLAAMKGQGFILEPDPFKNTSTPPQPQAMQSAQQQANPQHFQITQSTPQITSAPPAPSMAQGSQRPPTSMASQVLSTAPYTSSSSYPPVSAATQGYTTIQSPAVPVRSQSPSLFTSYATMPQLQPMPMAMQSGPATRGSNVPMNPFFTYAQGQTAGPILQPQLFTLPSHNDPQVNAPFFHGSQFPTNTYLPNTYLQTPTFASPSRQATMSGYSTTPILNPQVNRNGPHTFFQSSNSDNHDRPATDYQALFSFDHFVYDDHNATNDETSTTSARQDGPNGNVHMR